jgi:hypothetical protein
MIVLAVSSMFLGVGVARAEFIELPDAVFCRYRNRAAGRAEICNRLAYKLSPQPAAKALEPVVDEYNTKVRALASADTVIAEWDRKFLAG